MRKSIDKEQFIEGKDYPSRSINNSSNSSKDHSSNMRGNYDYFSRSDRINPYIKILDQLPQEIKDKLDRSKENLDDMCKTLTLPKDCKPSHVIKWMKKVSQNELKIIEEEIFKIRVNERKLKRTERFSIESLTARAISMNSQKSETSSKFESERYVAIRSRDTPNKIINYNATLGEGNSACSKTSSNTKPAPNLVRIPLEKEKIKLNRMKYDHIEAPNYLKLEPKIISINPGKSILLKFESPNQHIANEEQNLRWKLNIMKNMKAQDIIVEDLESKSVQKDIFPPRLPNNVEHSIHVFSSVGWHNEPDLINFNWPVHWESQNEDENYLKVDQKYCDLGHSNISQMIESVEGCGDFYLHKPLILNNNDPIKGFNMGGHSLILNHFWNNITPIFSITEELADQLRPNVLEFRDISKANLELSQNLQAFPCGEEGEMMLTEEYKNPIDTHNH